MSNHTRPLFTTLVAALVLGLQACASAQPAAAAKPPSHYWAYFGTYTGPDSKGIYRSDFDPATGALSAPELVGEAVNPSFLAVAPNHKWLYAIDEVNEFGGKKAGGLTGFTIGDDGKLASFTTESSVGVGPAHLAVDHAGKWLLVGNYGGGSTALLPIDAEGKLGPAKSFIVHDAVKPQVSHAHCANFSADGKFAFICDAGVDKVHQFKVDAEKGLVANKPDFVQIGEGKGTGPRHMVFSLDNKRAYVINETNMTMTTLDYNAVTGTLTPIQTVSTLPEGQKVQGSTAEVVLHPSGKFLFGSNRGFNSIVTFAVNAKDGKLTQTAQQRTGIKTPRNFNVDPTGRFLLVANQDGDSIVVFSIDPATGALTPVGEPTKLSKPVCIVFMEPLK